jgi:predicted nucleic acid-binding protein
MKYLLDTNICVHFLRGKFEVDKILKAKSTEKLHFNLNQIKINITKKYLWNM